MEREGVGEVGMSKMLFPKLINGSFEEIEASKAKQKGKMESVLSRRGRRERVSKVEQRLGRSLIYLLSTATLSHY